MCELSIDEKGLLCQTTAKEKPKMFLKNQLWVGREKDPEVREYG